MFRRIDRRHFVQSGSTFAFASLLPQRLWANIDDIPVSPFGETSTADEVAQGIDLTGKTALITGVNSGIGYETMRTLAANGAHVIGSARTMEKAQTACDSVEGTTTPVVCELTDFDSIVACTKEVAALNTPIDMLICNAGVMALPELEQVNGIEKQFTINHLGHYILTRRLLGQVEQAEQGRIVVLTSIAYKRPPEGGIEFDNLSGEDNYSPWRAYGQSKLANALFSSELARRYEGTSTTSNSVHPGLVKTNLGRYIMAGRGGGSGGRPSGSSSSASSDSDSRPSGPMGNMTMKTPAQGAATTVYVGVHPNLAGVRGYYFEDCNPVTPTGPYMLDSGLATKLWDVSEEMTKDYLA